MAVYNLHRPVEKTIHDFENELGTKFELKSEQYKIGDRFDKVNKISPNVYMERYTMGDNTEFYVDGGPWGARNKEAKYFISFFPRSSILLVFNTNELIDTLERMNLKLGREVKNIGRNGYYHANGFAVRISKLSHIYKEFEYGSVVSIKYINELK